MPLSLLSSLLVYSVKLVPYVELKDRIVIVWFACVVQLGVAILTNSQLNCMVTDSHYQHTVYIFSSSCPQLCPQYTQSQNEDLVTIIMTVWFQNDYV